MRNQIPGNYKLRSHFLSAQVRFVKLLQTINNIFDVKVIRRFQFFWMQKTILKRYFTNLNPRVVFCFRKLFGTLILEMKLYKIKIVNYASAINKTCAIVIKHSLENLICFPILLEEVKCSEQFENENKVVFLYDTYGLAFCISITL